jgi:hypothetical protein
MACQSYLISARIFSEPNFTSRFWPRAKLKKKKGVAGYRCLKQISFLASIVTAAIHISEMIIAKPENSGIM